MKRSRKTDPDQYELPIKCNLHPSEVPRILIGGTSQGQTIKVGHWNVNSIKSQKARKLALIDNSNLAIISVQEPRENSITAKLYHCHYSQPARRRDNGLKFNAAILVSNQLRSELVDSEEDFISVSVKGPLLTNPICAISLYVRENKTLDEKI